MAAALKIGERAAVIQHIAAMFGKPFVGFLRIDARLGIITRHALAGNEPLDAHRARRRHAERNGAQLRQSALDERDGVDRRDRAALTRPRAQTRLHLGADIPVRNGVEIVERRRIREHDRAELLALQYPIFYCTRKTGVDLREHGGIGRQQLMIHRVAVDDERTLALELHERGRFAAAGAARDADDVHFLHECIPDGVVRHGGGAQNAVRCAREVDERGLPANAAGAAVDDGRDLPVEIRKHVIRRLRARRAGGIGGWRGQRQLCSLDERKRGRGIRAAQANGLPACAHDLGHAGLRPQHDRERAGPERLGERVRRRRHINAVVRHGRLVVHHQRQRLYGRPALDLIDLRDGSRIQPVAGKAIDRLRRDGDELAGADGVRCLRDLGCDSFRVHASSADARSFSA